MRILSLEKDNENLKSEVKRLTELSNQYKNEKNQKERDLLTLIPQYEQCKAENNAKADTIANFSCREPVWTDFWWLILVGLVIAMIDERWTRWVFNRRKKPEEEEAFEEGVPV
jgi:hypothetical protein